VKSAKIFIRILLSAAQPPVRQQSLQRGAVAQPTGSEAVSKRNPGWSHSRTIDAVITFAGASASLQRDGSLENK
jgi:hypothetical protein